MKVRPVSYVHIAAFVFSIFVLIISACSFYRPWDLQGTSGTKLNWIILDDGQLSVTELHDWPWKEPFRFTHRLNRSELDEVFIDYSSTEFDFLGFKGLRARYWLVRVFAERDRGPKLARVLFAPISALLLGPIAWMSCFYLFKIRQLLRRRSVSIKPGASCVPSE